MKLALLGNQNSGKTTLFNVLTGTNQKVGNWPGVTIERKEGHIKGTDTVIVDLPGVYSLSPYTAEEEVSRKFVLENDLDVIVNIVDATQLERSLYLTTQILETGKDVVIALNMTDILEKEGITIDEKKLEEELGISVVPISAKKRLGIDELIKIITTKSYKKNPNTKIYSEDIEELIAKIREENHIINRFNAVKIIERDILVGCSIAYEEDVRNIEEKLDMDSEQFIAHQRYLYIEEIKEKCFTALPKKETNTDKLDKVFLNKWAAIPIFIGIMALVYILSVGLVGGLTVSLVDALFNGAETVEFNFFGLTWESQMNILGLGPWLSNILTNMNASDWVISLVSDGIVGGVGAVLNFVPQIIILFTCLSLLETTGYMSRIAFFLDRIFHKFGLSGKSLIPFIVGVGCSVPGIMASRTVEDDDEKKMTIVLTPFIPCSAKLPIISLFAGFFFPQVAWLVSLGSYVVAIIIILICGLIFKKLLFKGHTSTFITELPTYKLPSASYVLRDVGEKALSFVKRAGTIILLCSVVIWFLVSFTWKFEYVPDNPDQSLLANFGKGFAWIFAPMLGGNISWEAAVSAIQGLVAKEQVVGSLEIISNIPGSAEPYLSVFDPNIVGTSAYFSGIAYMMFNLFSAPCFGAIGAMRHEFGSTKKTLLAIFFQTGLAWVIASLIGSIGFFF